MSGTPPILKLDRRRACVLDTNVLLELYSIHDLSKLYARLHAAHGDAAASLPQVLYRRIRAGEALLLAVALHETCAITFHLMHEAIRLLTARVAPAERAMESIFTQLFVHYIRVYALSNWTTAADPQLDQGLSGEQCDDLLLGVAHESGIPLVTNEGNLMSGIDEMHGLRAKARALNVAVFTPGEYVRQLNLDMASAVRAFADRFDLLQGHYIRTRGQPDDADNVRVALATVGKAYQWCLEALKQPTRCEGGGDDGRCG